MRTLTGIEPADKIVPRILKQYLDTPRGWRVLTTPRGEIIVVGPDSAFQLQLIPLSPYEFTGAGIELSDTNSIVEGLRESPEYGLRPLDERDVQKLVESMSDPVAAQSNLESIIKRTPVSPHDTSTVDVDLLLSGPIFTRPNLTDMHADIKNVQRSLEKSAHDLFRKRFPERAGMFF